MDKLSLAYAVISKEKHGQIIERLRRKDGSVSGGHYDGDTLVVDTVGMNDKTYLDGFRTPHTDKLHVVEAL